MNYSRFEYCRFDHLLYFFKKIKTGDYIKCRILLTVYMNKHDFSPPGYANVDARISTFGKVNFELGSCFSTVLRSLRRGRLVSGTCLEDPHVNVTRDYLIRHVC